jgi:hypothetical protein
MNQVFELAGDLVPPKVAHDLMRLLAEGAGEDDEDADSLLQSSAALLSFHCWSISAGGILFACAKGAQAAICSPTGIECHLWSCGRINSVYIGYYMTFDLHPTARSW